MFRLTDTADLLIRLQTFLYWLLSRFRLLPAAADQKDQSLLRNPSGPHCMAIRELRSKIWKVIYDFSHTCHVNFVTVQPVSITHDALERTIQGHPGLAPCHVTSLYSETPLASLRHGISLCKENPSPPLLLTSGGQDWIPIQTCSFEDLPPVLTSGGYWITYGWHKRAVRILLECFFVNDKFLFARSQLLLWPKSWVRSCTCPHDTGSPSRCQERHLRISDSTNSMTMVELSAREQ